jgi:hypothetical protein
MAAWFYDKFAAWTYTGGEPERELTRDEMLQFIPLNRWMMDVAIKRSVLRSDVLVELLIWTASPGLSQLRQ